MTATDPGAVVAAPSHADLRALRTALTPWRLLTRPRWLGLENVPREGPVLLVGNHTLYGFFDVPLVVSELHAVRGMRLRGLGDHGHFKIPVWRTLFARCGAVDGTRDNCRMLMRTGQPVLVYPGGAREVHKRKREKYRLLWDDRTGFAELAIEYGYPIVPFATVGGEEVYDIVIDRDDALAAPVQRLIRAFGGRPELMPPLGRGLAGSPLPRPKRIAYGFGRAIAAERYSTRPDGPRALQRRVRASVNRELQRLLR